MQHILTLWNGVAPVFLAKLGISVTGAERRILTNPEKPPFVAFIGLVT